VSADHAAVLESEDTKSTAASMIAIGTASIFMIQPFLLNRPQSTVTAIDHAAFDRGQLGENIGDTPAQNSETFAFHP
jgi:hypothetical protein